MLRLIAVYVVGAVLVAGCGSSTTSSGAPACVVSAVTVSANPASISTSAATTLTAAVNGTSSCAGGVTWSATPTGGTLTPSGLTATFTATTAGAYTIRATSTDDQTKSATATVTVSAPAPCQPTGTVTTHAADILASETWAGDGTTHQVTTSIAIRNNAVLTIQPCAIVTLGPGVTITVRDNGRLVSAGTGATRFVTFRRSNATQAWGALRGFHPTTLIDLSWTRLEGGGSFGGSLGDPTVTVFGNGYGSPTLANLRVNNVTIDGSQGVGVYLDANAAFTTDSQLLTITGAGARPVAINMMALGSLPSGTYTGTAINEILIFGSSANVFANMTVEDRGVPVRLQFGNIYVGPVAPSIAPVTLTLRPGVVFKFPRLQPATPGARMTFGTNGNSPNNLVGVLNAIGTAAKPIIFTSGEATPAPGDWVGLWLNTATGSRLDYVEINYAGAPTGIQSNNCRPANTRDEAALFVGDFETQYVPPANLITNSKITFSAGFGINAMWQAGTFNSPDLTATNTFQNNARCRQTWNGLTPPGTCPMGGGCTQP